MAVSRDDVQKIAHLARIETSESERDALTEQLNAILNLVSQLNDVATDDVAPLAHPLDAKQRLRNDTVATENRRDDYLSLAPSSEAGLFLVPQVIE